MELSHLDTVVDELAAKFDGMVEGFESEIPPTPEEASAWEEEKIAGLNEEYDEKAKGITGRDPEDDQDNMAVRKRMLNRKLGARKGKLLGRFGDAIADMQAKAVSVLTDICGGALNEFENDIKGRMPIKGSDLQEAFAAMKASVDDDVNAAYPGGVDALDSFDDDLGDCPSYEQWQASADEKLASLEAENKDAVESAKMSYKIGIFMEIRDQMDEDEDMHFLEDNGEDLKATIRKDILEALGIEQEIIDALDE